MPTVVQFRRGTTAQNNSFTGAVGELSIDLDLDVLRVHDGVTLGGFSMVTATAAQSLTNKSYAGSTVSVTGNITGGNISTAGQFVTGVLSATGNITGGNVLTAGLISATGNITTSGIITVNSGSAVSAIVNGAATGVGNIGSATVGFNTLFGKATTAQYADLAENYSADACYPPGTVLSFGGLNEVTISMGKNDPRVAGVVSTNPAHLMNSTLDSEYTTAVALTGRVLTKVVGQVRKGDMMVTAGNGCAKSYATPTMGTVIGKALENFDGESGIIEVVVGRM